MYSGLVKREEPLRETCPVCGRAAEVRDAGINKEKNVLCQQCGYFAYTIGSQQFLEQARNSDLSYKISYELRTTAERQFRRGSKEYTSYKKTDFERCVKSRDLFTKEKLALLLRHVGALSAYADDTVFFAETDFPIINARNNDEAYFYIKALTEQNLIQRVKRDDAPVRELEDRFGSLDLFGSILRVTAAGWLELDREIQEGSQSAYAFIAMWFDKQKDDVHRSIRTAIERSGYLPQRLDEHLHVNRIDDEIIAQLRRSKFLVADLTDQNNGAYFEAGFMLGMGRPVVWICDKRNLDKVHFDTRQYSTIDYGDLADLEKRLQNKIEALFGEGPHKGKTQ